MRARWDRVRVLGTVPECLILWGRGEVAEGEGEKWVALETWAGIVGRRGAGDLDVKGVEEGEGTESPEEPGGNCGVRKRWAATTAHQQV